MKLTFGELQDHVAAFLKKATSNLDADELTAIKLKINQAYAIIMYMENWEWRKRSWYLTTIPPYSTGTVTVTQGSKTITGSGTTFLSYMALGWIKVSEIAYKIQSFDSATQVTIEAPYPDDTEAGKSYSIIFPEYVLNHEISAISDVKTEGISLDVVDKDQLVHDIAATGNTQRVGFGGLLRDNQFDSSTVTVTNASKTVTLAAGTFPVNIDNTNFRVNEHSKLYTIKTRDSATQLTLRENYQGTGGSGKAYAINPQGNHLLRFAPTPDDYYYCEIEGLIGTTRLIDNTDYTLLPDDFALISGAIWLAALEFKNENPVRIQQARADFERQIEQYRKIYKAIGNARWTSESEVIIKKQGGTIFDPLRTND